jgi:hypothetical protein
MENYRGCYSNDPKIDNYLFCKKRGYFDKYKIYENENGMFFIEKESYRAFKIFKTIKILKEYYTLESAITNLKIYMKKNNIYGDIKIT